MQLKFLPEKIRQAIFMLNIEFLYEIKFRLGYPIKINYKGKISYLTACGTSLNSELAIICTLKDIEYIINSSTEHSIYAFNDRIKEGFITVENGVRIGLCGECVFSNNILHTIKNFTSLNVRIPHLIHGCSDDMFRFVFENNNLNNTLIVSPPFLGKTTMLKDIAKKLNELNKYSILIIDERGEFECVEGENIDSIKYCDKNYAFNYGIRAISPEVVITDELISKNDWACAKKAVCSGIKIIASCHSDNIEHLCKKEHFGDEIFDRYVILSQNAFGKIKEIYDKDFNRL